MYRGEIWWANLPDPVGAEPGYRRPVLIIQDDTFNQSLISTVIVVIMTSNLRLAAATGNVLLPSQVTGLPKDSVANVSQVFTIDKTFLQDCVGTLPAYIQEEIDEGLRTVMYL
jgi:mRNA interferase MazF